MKKITLALAVIASTCLGLSSAQAETYGLPTGLNSHFNVFICALPGPVKSNPIYQTWSVATTDAIRAHGQSDKFDTNHSLIVANISQPADNSNTNLIWFGVKIAGKTVSDKLSLSMLRFTEHSSDSANSLANIYDLTTMTNLVYGPQAIGVVWNTNGPGYSDTVYDNSLVSGTNMVNEIDFIGMQSPYYPYSNTSGSNSISTYVYGFTNFLVTGNCAVVSNGVVLAYGQKTLQTVGDAPQPVLSIFGNPGQIWVGGDTIRTNTTIKLYHSDTVQPPVWSFVETMNSGDIYFTTNYDLGFFRATLE
jgi:hypothetical protein